jgi:RsiW-degrading membrane proteinase PrsW (M82 family)
MLLPGIAFVIFISRLYWLMSNSSEHPEYTARFVIEFSIFTALVSFIVVYRLCGKAKPYLVIAGVMAAEVVILSLHSVVSLPFCEATGANAIFKQQDIAIARQAADQMPGFLATFWAYFTCAGLLEELEKMLPVFGLIWFARRSTRTDTRRWGVFEPLDAIVYASAAALAFIMLETFSSDASYVGSDIAKALTKSALEGRLTALFSFPTAILRTIDALAGHMAYSGYFAYFVGLGLLRPQHRERYWLGGLLATALIHGLYDATTGSTFMRTLSLAVTFFLLIAAILNGRKVSPTRDENFATRAYRQPRSS